MLFVFPAKPLKTSATGTGVFLRVCSEVQPLCRIANYAIMVVFGVESEDNCDFSNNVTQTARSVKPGDQHCFDMNTTVLPLSPGDQFCYKVSLIRNAGLLDGRFISKQLVFLVTITVLTRSGHW